MTYINVFITLLAACFALASVGESCSCQNPHNGKGDLKKLAMANNELAFNLNRLFCSDSSENVVFSPYSISVNLGMLFYGARKNTAKELRKALGYDYASLSSDQVSESFHLFFDKVLKSSGSSNQYVLDSANAILVDKHLKLIEKYETEVKEDFQADFSQVDMKKTAAVVKQINDFVNKKTRGKIPKLLDQLDPSTVMFLLNAVYFKGTWETKFDASLTSYECFYNYGSEAEETEVETMHLTSKFSYAAVDDCQALELPYKGNNVSMIILLPNEIDGLQDLQNNLTPKKLAAIQQKMYKTKVEVSLPKFQLEFKREISKDMKSLGANQIFNAGSADFSGITTSKNLVVSQILHKAVIKVNEEGSEAAAVTGTGVTTTAVQIPQKFNADHPYLFLIREISSNIILFLGCVNSL